MQRPGTSHGTKVNPQKMYQGGLGSGGGGGIGNGGPNAGAGGMLKQNLYEDEEGGGGGGLYNANNNMNNNAFGVKNNRPSTDSRNRIIYKDDVMSNNKQGGGAGGEYNIDDDIGFAAKDMNAEIFMLQDIQKMIPKNTPIEKEKLYEETLHLKNLINKLRDENLKLRTRNLTLERECAKLTKIVNKAGQAQINIGIIPLPNESSLINNLKRQNKELREDIKVRLDEIETLKRNSKVTRYQELETELKTFIDENFRLKSLLEQQIRMNPQIKLEDYNTLEEKYYMQTNLLDSLQKDVTQYKQVIKFLEDENGALKEHKESEDKNSKRLQNEVNKLRKQLKDKEQEIHKLVTYYKYDPESLNKKYNMNNGPQPKSNVNSNQKEQRDQRESQKDQKDSKDQQQQEEYKKIIGQKEKKIEELEQCINELNEKMKEKEKQWEDQRLALESKYSELEKAYRLLEEKYNEQSNQLDGNYRNNPKNNTQLMRGRKITYDDIKDIGYELTLILRLKQIPYDELESKLFDEKNSSTPISIEDLKIILLSDPFELNDINNAYMAARFLFENDDDNFDANDPRKKKELGLLKNNFRKLIGKYYLITEEIEKELFDTIAQTLAKYEESVRAHFDTKYAKDEIVTHRQLVEGFRALEIELDDSQMDYLILRLYDLSHNLEELEYAKMFEIFQTEENIRLKQIFDMYNENMNDLHQIRETDSEERDRIKSIKNQSNQKSPNKGQIDEDYDNEFDDDQPHEKSNPKKQKKTKGDSDKSNKDDEEGYEYENEGEYEENNQEKVNKSHEDGLKEADHQVKETYDENNDIRVESDKDEDEEYEFDN